MSEITFRRIRPEEVENTQCDLVFIHGIDGDAKKTWTHSHTDFFWPESVEESYPHISVSLIDHSAAALSNCVSGSDLDLLQYSNQLAKVLEANNIGQRPFVFVCHSLGGLFAKAVLRKLSDSKTDYGTIFLDNCCGVQFFATPHSGASIANVMGMIPGISSQIISDLRKDSSYLQDLADWYTVASDRNDINTLGFRENKKLMKVLVVNADSSNPRTQEGPPYIIDEHHTNICKFQNSKSPHLVITTLFISNWLDGKIGAPTSKEAPRESRPSPAKYIEHLSEYFSDREKTLYSDELEELVDLTEEEISKIPNTDSVKQLFKELVQLAYSDHSSDTIGLGRFIVDAVPQADSLVGVPAEKIRTMFHNDHMVESRFKQMKLKGRVYSFEEFAQRLAQPIESLSPRGIDARNETLLLEGDVGMGKTTTLSHIMYKHSNKFFESNIVPVRIDMELINEGDILNVSDFFTALVPILSNACQRFMSNRNDVVGSKDIELSLRDKNQRCLATNSGQHSLSHIKTCVSDYLREIKIQLGISFCIIVDNLDAQYHLYDRHLFSVPGQVHRAKACDALRVFFDSFENEQLQPLGNLGIRVLFVLRPNTREYLSTAKIRNISKRRTDGVFKLMPPRLFAVVDERNRLLAKLCRMHKDILHPTDYKYLHEFIQRFSIRVGAPSVRKRNNGKYFDGLSLIESISNQGLRRTIDHISRYVWSDEEENSLGRRFSNQYHSQIICFVLGDKCRFHQFSSHFPNLFLTRGDKVGNLPYLGIYNDSVRLHPQTYWLKYLVAWYIRNEESVTPESVLSIFSNDGEIYPEGVVEFCMASLAHVDSTNLAIPKFRTSVSGRGLTVDNLKVTKRGIRIFDDLVWTFNYLQLIVEDPYLPIPKLFKHDFEYVDGLHYGYFVENDEQYDRKRGEMVEMKAKQVFLFLHILEGTLKIEVGKYPELFKKLKSRGFIEPDFNSIRTNIEEVVVKMLSIGMGKSRTVEKEVHIKGLRTQAELVYSANESKLKELSAKVW